RIDCSSRQRKPLIGNHEAQIVIDRVAETLAARASPKRIVEAEQARLRLPRWPMANRAFIRPGKPQTPALPTVIARSFLKNHLACFAVTSLHGIHNPCAILGADHNSVQKHEHWREKVEIDERLRRR